MPAPGTPFIRALDDANALVTSLTSTTMPTTDVAALADGTFVVVSDYRADIEPDTIWGKRVNADGTDTTMAFSVAARITDPYGTPMGQSGPVITATAEGGFFVAWTAWEFNGGYNPGKNVMGHLYDSNGTALGPQFTAAYRTNPDGSVNTATWEYDPALATLPNGDIVAVLTSQEHWSWWNDISGLLLDPDTMPDRDAFNVDGVAPNVWSPEVTAIADGFVAVWTGAGDGKDVFFRRFDLDGNPAGPAMATLSDTYGDQDFARVVTLENGNVVVIWGTDYEPGTHLRHDGIWCQTYDPDGNLVAGTRQLRPGATISSNGDDADVVALPGGGFLLVYSLYSIKPGNSYGDRDVFMSRYDSQGNMLGEELRVNPGDASLNDGNQFRVSAAVQPDGRVLVSWYDEGAGVYSRLMEIADIDGTATAGDDFIAFTQGARTIDLLGGDDVLSLGPQADTADGGAGNDTLSGGDGSDGLAGGTGDDSVFGEAGNDRLFGDAGNDYLDGGDGADRLDGGTGLDVMAGGPGNDTYLVDSIGDTVTGEVGFASGGGIDTVFASVDFTAPANIEVVRAQPGAVPISLTGNDAPGTLVGNDGNNTLNGRGGNDQINGNAGNDTIIGGEGRDTLVGGTGADTFVFSSVSNSRAGAANRDVINGFDRGATQDIIDLQAIDANTLTFGVNDAFSFIGTAAFALGGASAGQLRVQGLGGPNAVIVEGDINGDRVADIQIFVNLTTTMLAGDFLL